MKLVDGTPFKDIGSAPAGAGRYDFFVSYVPADQEWAAWIASQLEDQLRLDGRQPKVFFRGWDVVAGTHETASRHLALAASDRLVAVLTPDYLASGRYAIEEWSAVSSNDPNGFQRQIVPVRVKACEPSGLLRSVLPIDLVGRNEKSAVNTLFAGLNASLGGRARPATAPLFPGLGRPTEDRVAGPRFPGPPVFVGEPPAVPPNWFQDRAGEVEDLERRLDDVRTRLVMLVGREGFGKTALIHRLWERMRTGDSPLRVYGLVYLSAHGFWPVTADYLIDRLTELFPTHEADRLKITVQQPLPPVEKLAAVLAELAGRNVIVAIDAIEDTLGDDEDIADPALRELLDYLVPRADCGVRLLLAGRHVARAVAQQRPDVKPLNEGLPDTDAFALLNAMDSHGRLNFTAVPDHDRARLHRLTGGSPRALELAYGVLAPEGPSFVWLLEFLGRVDGRNVAVRLLDLACERLSLRERRVLQALAVYGRPIPATAVDHLMHNAVPDLDSRATLGQLRQLRLARSDGVYFSVPATEERDNLIELVRRDADTGACETLEMLLRRAADYFVGQRHRKPQQLADVRPQLIEIELRLRAGDHEAAFQLMESVDDGYLLGWGSSCALVPLLEMLLRSEGIPRILKIDARSMFARALMQQEDYREAMVHLDQALGLASGFGQVHRRIALREQLTAAHLRLGNLQQAAIHSRKAFLAAIVRRRPRLAMTALADWAMCLAREGRFVPALRLYAVARSMLTRYGTAADRIHQPVMVFGEAWVHGQLGHRDHARSLLQEAQRDAVGLDARRWVGECLLGEAQLALDDGDPRQAVDLAEEASAIGVRDGNRRLCRVAMEILALARLGQDDLAAAARAADIARRNRGSVLSFGLVGLVAYRRGEHADAKAAFDEGYLQASGRYRPSERDFQFLDAYGLVACGLALLGEPSCLDTALTVCGKAREITTASGACGEP